MAWLRLLCVLALVSQAYTSSATAGIEALVQRRLPRHTASFSFKIENSTFPRQPANTSLPQNDRYTVAKGQNQTVLISGNSPIALASGLRWYLTNYVHVDIYWFIGSRLHLAPKTLPQVNQTYHGESIVPWRYHFNTVTFSYTTAFWSWEEWETQLDWMALHGINLPLAWVGYEKILMDVLLDVGFTAEEIASFFSGPAFQAWNRFGNVQGSWDNGGQSLPLNWIDSQFELQKKIVRRMVELGMTPVLPSFTGFVPRAISRVIPDAKFVNGSQWSGFPSSLTNTTFLEPMDPHFTDIQKRFISRQSEAYGNVTHIYTLDQFNENNPESGDLDYLRDTAKGIIGSLKAADEHAVWMLQGWLFYSSQKFWSNERVEAYLDGVNDTDILILDLFSESQPQWQRTRNYYGKPWIWCELHGYGGNSGIYGQVENVTRNSISALDAQGSTMVGIGLTPEGQEGNEVMYDLMLDQAWSNTPIKTADYFHAWVDSRYNSRGPLPSGVYRSWDILRRTALNNTHLDRSEAVTKSIFELSPNTTGLLDRTGHHATTIIYDPRDLQQAWREFYESSSDATHLLDDPAYVYDLTDITRQVLANAFYPLYTEFIAQANRTAGQNYSTSAAQATGVKMISLLKDLDAVLSASPNKYFHLSTWIASARQWQFAGNSTLSTTNALPSPPTTEPAAFYEYSARNQITLWGPNGEIVDYASKQWGGLIRSFIVPRWERFIAYTLNGTTTATGVNEPLKKSIRAFELEWQTQVWGERPGESYVTPSPDDFVRTIERVRGDWKYVFGS